MRTAYLNILLALLLLTLGSSNVYCGVVIEPKITISGTVVDESNEPIIGSSVYLKSGSHTVGCVSDFDGKFALSVVPEGGTFGVTVSYVGYKTLTHSFYVQALTDNKGTIKVRLLEDKRKNKNKKSSVIAQDFGHSSYDFLFNNIQASTKKQSPQDLCDEGDKYYNGTDGVTQNYTKALELYLQAAEQGYDWAQARVGYMYDEGLGAPEDNVKAMSWYTKAAEQGNVTAQNNIGALYENGEGVTKDYTLAAQWYQKAAEEHNARSQANLAELYFFGRGVPQDYNQSFIWALRAGGQGDRKGQFRIGYLYETGKGVTQSYKLAREWYLKAAEQGDTGSMINLGILFKNGRGVKKNDSEALAWYNKAADKGNTTAKKYAKELTSKGVKPAATTTAATMDLSTLLNTCMPKNEIASTSKASASTTPAKSNYDMAWDAYAASDYEKALQILQKAVTKDDDARLRNLLGFMYLDGRGVKKDYAKALEHLKIGAAKGNSDAQCNLGYMYEEGLGVTKNMPEAIKWYEKSEAQGNIYAQGSLAKLYFYGIGVPKDTKRGIALIEKAASSGDAMSQSDAGYYLSEDSPEQDYNKAFEWTQKAANQGYAIANNNLGWYYEHGYGVSTNLFIAVEYYKAAADQDNPSGLANLGRMYENGYGGLPVDYSKAMELYLKAADKNSYKAMRNIAKMYEKGLGVEIDYLNAMQWYRKAKEGGDEEAKSRLEEFNQRLSGSPVAASSNTPVSQPQAATSQNDLLSLPETPKRIALIIGNDDYGAQRLDNPVKDATALNAVLQLLGFETNAYINLDKDETERLVAEFTEKASNYDMALFYYAGHAIQSKGVNYLVPARPEPVLNHADVKRKYVDLPFIVNSMIDAEAKRNIIILDACRDTPDFIGVKTRGAKNGLAYITEPEKFLVAYSTQAGMTAADGKGMEHSPFMTVLLEQLKVPGLNVDQLFVRVRDNVQEMTHNEQRPFFKNNLSELPSEKFYFNRGK